VNREKGPGGDARPGIPLQGFEKVETAPENFLTAAASFPQDVIARSPQGDVAIQSQTERPAAPGSPRSARDDVAQASAPGAWENDERPGIPSQHPEKIDSAPGFSAAAEFPRDVLARRPEGSAATQANAEPAPAIGTRRSERSPALAPHEVADAVFAWSQRLSSARARPGRKQMAP
jgi:hypothetical protein